MWKDRSYYMSFGKNSVIFDNLDLSELKKTENLTGGGIINFLCVFYLFGRRFSLKSGKKQTGLS